MAHLTAPGMKYFIMWLAPPGAPDRTAAGGNPLWGVASIDVDAVAEVNDTPEPATLTLCVAGLAGGFVWRRRRAARG